MFELNPPRRPLTPDSAVSSLLSSWIYRKPQIFHQPRYSLLSLPREIREAVWGEVLGTGILHITHSKNGLMHIRCTDPDAVICGEIWNTNNHGCWAKAFVRVGLTMPPTHQLPHESLVGSLLALLKTCRQMCVHHLRGSFC